MFTLFFSEWLPLTNDLHHHRHHIPHVWQHTRTAILYHTIHALFTPFATKLDNSFRCALRACHLVVPHSQVGQLLARRRNPCWGGCCSCCCLLCCRAIRLEVSLSGVSPAGTQYRHDISMVVYQFLTFSCLPAAPRVPAQSGPPVRARAPSMSANMASPRTHKRKRCRCDSTAGSAGAGETLLRTL